MSDTVLVMDGSSPAAPTPLPPGREHPAMQRDNERGRVVVEGRRSDDNQTCSLVVAHEIDNRWVLCPHGAGTLGVRLEQREALEVPRAILGSK